MYNVVKELKKIEKVRFLDEKRGLIKEVPFRKVFFYPIGYYEEGEFLDSLSEIDGYNNLIVEWDDNKMTIFQDYGDGCASPPAGYDNLERSLVVSDRQLSLGYYNGWFVSIDRLGSVLLVQRLFNEELPNLDELNWKRPYSLYLLHKDNKLYYYVNIRTDEEYNFEFLVEAKFLFEEVFSVKNIQDTLSTYPARFVYADYNLDGLITRDLLVYRGFSYSNGVWRKGSIEIEDNQRGCPPDRNFCYNGESIWFVEDLDEIMRREQS